MHEAALARAAAPAQAVVLGMLLRPLSLGHVLYFHREEIHKEISSGKLSANHLSTAVLICCQSWDQLKSMRSDWLLSLKLWIWKRRTARAEFKHSKSVGAVGSYFRSEAEKFLSYVAEGSIDLPLSDTPRADVAKGRPMGSPFILSVHSWIVEHLRLTESQAWDYPYGLGRMRFACHAESQGHIDIYNEADDSMNRFVAEQEAMGAKSLAQSQ